MNRRMMLATLGVVAAMLIITITYELFAGNSDETQMTAAIALDSPGVQPAGAVVKPVAERAADWGTIALGRPLFSATRRPEPAQTTQQASSSEEASDQLPRLAGIVMLKDVKQAIFQPQGDHKPILVGEGGLVSGWTVEKIEAAEVTLIGPGGTTTLQPKFDENAAPAPQQIPVMPVGRGQFGVNPGSFTVPNTQPNDRSPIGKRGQTGAPPNAAPRPPTATATQPPLPRQQGGAVAPIAR
jgi:hypothetical protein